MADLELNSIGNGDGNNYLLRDNSKIPLSGSNAISGNLIPATDNSIDVGSSTKNLKMLYTKGITLDGKTIDTDADGNLVYDGHIVDTIEEQGNGYIRYTNGIQICWGGGINDNNIATGKSAYTFPKAFNAKPTLIASAFLLDRYSVVAEATSTTTFAVGFISLWVSPPDYAPYSVPFNYIAIGTWK